MSELHALTKDKIGNYIFPFFWQHHESEDVLRTYMKVIDEANIKAVCIESRPHPEFCQDGWWHDLDIIFNEAIKRDMKVWILDDSHFPSGYSNGALKGKYPEFHRKFLTYKSLTTITNTIFQVEEEYLKVPPHQKTEVEKFMMADFELLPGDKCVGFVAVSDDKKLVQEIQNNEYLSGSWEVFGIYETFNRGPHRDYINMCDRRAVRLFIDTVYEAHYARYKQYFGNVLEGFFSDEPELGNGHLYDKGKKISELDDYPFSDEVEMELQNLWQEQYLANIALLFVDLQDQEKVSKIRIQFMDAITRAVERNFSYQIGDWCREHQVKYIGHIIEDNNEHSRMGSSLGHYFRSLKGQSYAGIDDIGGQLIPFMEDAVIRSKFTGSIRDGVFYHFTLGKLASSAANIDPLKKGNSMCEAFGAYGWQEGVYLEKYLIDHLMVNGINHFVPHAFSPAPFPDPDCPPHFYAHGHNPQYRHFAELMKYTNRICHLLTNGKMIRRIAVLYHGEADWTGLEYMKEDVIARVLTEAHIDFDIIPSDVFTDSDYHYEIKDGKLLVSLAEYDAVVIPEYPVIRAEVLQALNCLSSLGGRVYAINKLPPQVIGKAEENLHAHIVTIEEFLNQIRDLRDINLSGDSKHVKYLHYEGRLPIYYFVNEGQNLYEGVLTLPRLKKPVIYDAWNNAIYEISYEFDDDVVRATIQLESRKSLIITEGEGLLASISLEDKGRTLDHQISIKDFQRSICTGIEYPSFKDEKAVTLPDIVENDYPTFGGYIRYSTDFEINTDTAILKIEGLLEGVEVFLNGESLGIQIQPTYIYDLSGKLNKGKNHLEIISATTLERFVPNERSSTKPTNSLGIQDKVVIYY